MDYFRNISYMVSHIYLMLFFYFFTIHRYSEKKTKRICLCFFLTLSVSDCLKLNIYPNSGLCYVIVTILQILITQFTNIYISRTRDSRVLFLGLSASNYVIAGSLAASVAYIWTNNMVLSVMVSIVVHSVILWFLYGKIKDIWAKFFGKEYISNWWELCLIPVFFYTGFTFIAFFPYPLAQNPQNILGVIIFLITMFVSYVVVFRYVQSESNRKDIYWKKILYDIYIKDLENQYHSVEQFEQNLKILRHDIRHYSGMIDHLLDQEEYGEIRKIVKHINEVVDENKIVKYCNHVVINTILSNMMDRAKSMDIKVNLEAKIANELSVDAYEFASVIANLFENALLCVNELEEGEKYVNADIQCTGRHLLVDFKNKYEGEIEFDATTGLPKSKKGKNHGFGMQSVLAFSEKIGGNIGCYCEDGIFHIMMFAKF